MENKNYVSTTATCITQFYDTLTRRTCVKRNNIEVVKLLVFQLVVNAMERILPAATTIQQTMSIL